MKAERDRERQTDRQTDRRTDRQTDRQTNRQTDRQTDRQTCSPKRKTRKTPGGGNKAKPSCARQLHAMAITRVTFRTYCLATDSSRLWKCSHQSAIAPELSGSRQDAGKPALARQANTLTSTRTGLASPSKPFLRQDYIVLPHEGFTEQRHSAIITAVVHVRVRVVNAEETLTTSTEPSATQVRHAAAPIALSHCAPADVSSTGDADMRT